MSSLHFREAEKAITVRSECLGAARKTFGHIVTVVHRIDIVATGTCSVGTVADQDLEVCEEEISYLPAQGGLERGPELTPPISLLANSSVGRAET